MPFPVVSIIVPVYNAETTLRRCIDSLLAQTFADFELIAVDDGSSDGSREVVGDYAARDPRVRLLTPGHGGVSAARNCGIEAAQGKWLTFVDADDYVAPGYLADLLIGADSAEFSISGYSVVNPGSQPQPVDVLGGKPLPGSGGICRTDEMLAAFSAYSLGFVWGKLFRRDIIGSAGLRFDRDITFGEDGIFCFSYFRLVDVCRVSAKSGYFYVRGADYSSLAFSAPAALRLAGLSRFLDVVSAGDFDRPEVRRKVESHYLDGLLATLSGDARSASPTLTRKIRYGCYDTIRRRLSPATYRPTLPFFFDFCGYFHWWTLYERLFKLIYL